MRFCFGSITQKNTTQMSDGVSVNVHSFSSLVCTCYIQEYNNVNKTQKNWCRQNGKKFVAKSNNVLM